ncbi:MAG TPA: ABC transporter ATP-binding protein [Firmicutes bacterium]|nr:ABC transporter ATP-binding protein [Bacillota bacterium]
MLLVLTSLFASIGVGMIGPWLTKQLIDRIIVQGNHSLLIPLVFSLLGVTILRGVFNYLTWYGREKIGQLVVFDLREELYRHLHRLSFSYYDKARTGQLMSRLTGDVDQTRVLLSTGFTDLANSVVTFCWVFVMLLCLDWRLTLVSLAATPFLLWEVMKVHKRLFPAWLAFHQRMAALTTVLQENITGVRAVKAFARENYEIEKFEHENRSVMEQQLGLSRIWRTSFPFMDFLSGLSWTLLIWYGGREVILGRITLGTLVAFNGYLWSLIWPIRHLGWLVNVLGQAQTAAKRIFEILDSPPAVESRKDAIVLRDMKGHVRFENVSFSYGDGPPILKNINLEVKPGETVAILGETGSGKTSLISLIPRFYDVTAGRVTVDGHDVRDLDLKSLRRNIGIALQETFLFSASIRDNIAYGKPDASDEEIIRASKIAQAHDFIMQLPEGYDTVVGERGVGLSGGQKQRVAIARAILTDPAILLLDDSTSSVDMETERHIEEALKEVMKGRTTFVIAHRFSTIMNADHIIVLKDGEIVEEGTHEELLRANGVYAEIYQIQFKDQVKGLDIESLVFGDRSCRAEGVYATSNR